MYVILEIFRKKQCYQVVIFEIAALWCHGLPTELAGKLRWLASTKLDVPTSLCF